MKVFWILLALFLGSISAQANESVRPAIMSKLVNKSLMLDISKVGEHALIAVGERGHVVRSTDGSNWQQMPVPTQTTLTAVTFYDQLLGWAVGHDSTILHTNDGGFSWVVQQHLPKLQRPLLDISFKNQFEGVAVGAYGLFYRTTDGGKTWIQEHHVSLLPQEDVEYLEELRKEDEEAYFEERNSILPHFNRIYVDGRTSYLTGEMGLIAKSHDFGKSWVRFPDIYHGSFFDVKRTAKGNLLAVGLRGNVFRSLKNGTPWLHSDTETTALLNQIVVANEDQLFIIGNAGVLLESNDDGLTFSRHNQADGKGLIAAAVFKNLLIVASEVGIKALEVVNKP